MKGSSKSICDLCNEENDELESYEFNQATIKRYGRINNSSLELDETIYNICKNCKSYLLRIFLPKRERIKKDEFKIKEPRKRKINKNPIKPAHLSHVGFTKQQYQQKTEQTESSLIVAREALAECHKILDRK